MDSMTVSQFYWHKIIAINNGSNKLPISLPQLLRKTLELTVFNGIPAHQHRYFSF